MIDETLTGDPELVSDNKRKMVKIINTRMSLIKFKPEKYKDF